jgi:hypothetical protein
MSALLLRSDLERAEPAARPSVLDDGLCMRATRPEARDLKTSDVDRAPGDLLDSRLAARTVYVLCSRSLHLEVDFRGVIREDVDLGAIRLVIHIAFAFIGRHYDPVPRRPVVITGVPLGIQQPPVVQPHNVRRREVLENRPQ